jgi:hypothetical protein
MVFVELGDRGFESEFATRELKPLDEIGGAGEEDAPPIFDEGEANGCRQVALTPAWRSEEDEIVAFFEPSVACADRHDLGLGDHRHGVEGEAVECFAGWETGFAEMTFDPSPVALGDLMFGQRGEEEKLRMLKDPSDEDHADALEWMGEDYDPSLVNLTLIEDGLADLDRRWAPKKRKPAKPQI